MRFQNLKIILHRSLIRYYKNLTFQQVFLIDWWWNSSLLVVLSFSSLVYAFQCFEFQHLVVFDSIPFQTSSSQNYQKDTIIYLLVYWRQKLLQRLQNFECAMALTFEHLRCWKEVFTSARLAMFLGLWVWIYGGLSENQVSPELMPGFGF